MESLTGALVGWKREPSEHGVVITLQVSAVPITQDAGYTLVNLALNERQLRSLARDLTRAADERGIQLFGGRRGIFNWFA